MCAIVLTTWPLAVGRRASRAGRELDRALEMFEEKGWLDEPAGYHPEPPPPEKVRASMDRHKNWEFEHLSFESGYEPWPEEPGRDRWLSYEANRTAHARVLRHPGEPRPWLVCLHGIRMGAPGGDFFLYHPEHLHRELGFNLLLPILPIHGPRRVGLVGGDRILSGDVMDTLHAAAQAMWDVRRLLGWLRHPDQAGPAVGVLGYSLGGYTAALLAGLEKELDAVVCINPAVDPSRLFWRNALSFSTRYLKTAGVTEEKTGALMRVISPLSLHPQVPRDRRTIFAGVADRVVPASEAASLWRHWEKPRAAWYQGTHRGFLRTAEGRDLVREALHASGVVAEKYPKPPPAPRT
jgi:dienelactone hydrolase